MNGREHWLKAEKMLATLEAAGEEIAGLGDETLQDSAELLAITAAMMQATATRALAHAQLAAAAPAYALHQAPREVVADSPNITPPAADQPVIPIRTEYPSIMGHDK